MGPMLSANHHAVFLLFYVYMDSFGLMLLQHGCSQPSRLPRPRSLALPDMSFTTVTCNNGESYTFCLDYHLLTGLLRSWAAHWRLQQGDDLCIRAPIHEPL